MSYKTPEQIASALLAPLGCIDVSKTLLPYSFTDKDGPFNAMADLYHPGLDLYIEIKCSHLNGKTSRSKAELAYNRIEPAKRFGQFASYYQVQNQWNHAASKHAIVQGTIGAPQYAIVFTKQPDEATVKRVEKRGIQAFNLSRFAGILAMQLDVQASIEGLLS